MPHPNERVMSMVRDEIRKNPGVSSADLFAKARKLSKDIGRLNIRQFHARYPLQVKRALAPKRRRARKTAAKATAPSATGTPVKRGPGRPPKSQRADARTAVRHVLLQLAKDIASAEQRVKFIDVIGGIDSYVDQVMQAAGR